MHRSAGGLLGSLAVMLTTIAPTPAAAQEAPVPLRVRLGGQAQIQFNTTSVHEDDVAPFLDPDEDVPGSTFETRRIRLSVEAAVADWITGRIQPDFALGDLDLADAWLNFAFDERAELRVGQFKKPFSLLFLTSSSLILPIERGLRIRRLPEALLAEGRVGTILDEAAVLGEEQQMLDALGYLGREIGAALHGRLGRFGYEAGVFNGEGEDELDGNDPKSVAGRVEYRLEGRPARVGLAASYRETRASLFGGPPRGLEGIVFSVDGEWGDFFRPGLHVLGELVLGENLVDGSGLWGAQVWLALFRARGGGRVEAIEPIARISYGNASDAEGDDGWLLTPGINVYLFRRNKVSLDWDVYLPGGDPGDAEHALRAQAQLYF
ncbi:MAG TPA: porin [Longimicrobiales bacterium]